MPNNFDLKKIPLAPASPKHSRNGEYVRFLQRRANRRHFRRRAWSAVFVLGLLAFSAQSLTASDQEALAGEYNHFSAVEQIRVAYFSRHNSLPVEQVDAKTVALAEYLREKKSPLASYAGELARLANWKLLVGIAHAESNLCKKTDKNNCWGIGPGGPWTFAEISQGLYYANYLLTKFDNLGMDKPETLVRTYVGYHNANWVKAVNNVFYELQERGLQ